MLLIVLLVSYIVWVVSFLAAGPAWLNRGALIAVISCLVALAFSVTLNA